VGSSECDIIRDASRRLHHARLTPAIFYAEDLPARDDQVVKQVDVEAFR
jgi:hypothetical protein